MLDYPTRGFNHVKHKGTAQVLELTTGGESQGSWGMKNTCMGHTAMPWAEWLSQVKPTKVARGIKLSAEHQENKEFTA